MSIAGTVLERLRQAGRRPGETDRAPLQAGASAEQLARIVITSADAILSLDAQGHIDIWNNGAERLFGYEMATARGHRFSELLGGGSAAEVESRWLFDEVQRTGFVSGHETACLAANGNRVEVEMTATLLRDRYGDTAGMSLILRDITKHKRREEENQRISTSLSQKADERNRELVDKINALGRANSELQKLDQTRSEFVSLVSHQIRAPLTNMGGAVQRMQSDCRNVNSTCARMFTLFEQQVVRLDRLVQGVLDASRLEAGEVSLQLEPASVLPIAQQAGIEIQARAPGRAIYLAEKPGLPLVYVDRDRIVEILTNLLDNADKYSPPGAEISIQARADETEVTISVRDRGPGIPPADLERIFDKFYRSDSSDSQAAYGYGLGLYVCQRLVEAQGGRIWAENHSDGGAVFSFALPVWQEKHDENESSAH